MTTAAHKPKKVAGKKSAPAKKAAAKKKVSTKSNVNNPLRTSCGVRELRQSASQILDQVKNGLVVEITEHGVPVARLVPIKNSLYEEYIESGLIIPAVNSNWRPTKNPIKIKGNKTSTEVLLELRSEERY
jgi:prevent-host-death family protein